MTESTTDAPSEATEDTRPRWRRWLGPLGGLGRGPLLMLAGTVLILLTAGGGVAASKLEENDRFCTSCHLAAERTYYNRAQFAMDHQDQSIPDLASAHYVYALNDPAEEAFRCVDCHRGRHTLPDRAAALALGAYDGLVYATGGGNPTEIERGEAHWPGLIESSCTDCHTETLLVLGFDNHFHNYLPVAEEAHQRTGDLFVPEETSFEDEQKLLADGLQIHETQATCLTCHQAHVSVVGGQRVQFVSEEARLTGCTQCHTDNGLEIGLQE